MRTTLHVFLLCLLCTLQACIAVEFLSASQTIPGTASSLVSAGQIFALGFFSPSGRTTESYLGIWYYRERNSETKTVVWVANRDTPVVVGSNNNAGVFQIASDGNLVVTDTSGERYWSSNLESSSSKNRTVKLTDSGNLVLSSQDGDVDSYMWQSFQHPTDTFLPGMKMDVDLKLTSWSDVNHPRSGNFTFKMSQRGKNLSRYAILDNQKLHWENEGLNSDSLSPDKLNYLANFTFHSPKFSEYQDTRIVMNSTGEIKFLKWEYDEWSMLWKQPSDNCNIYNYCGNFSSCVTNDPRACECLPGFKPKNHLQYEGGGFGGCVRKSAFYDNKNKDMVFLNLTMIGVGTPDQINDTDTEQECQSLCLKMSHPRCQAYSYNRSSSLTYDRSYIACKIWTQDLTTLQLLQQDGADLSVLVKRSDIAPTAKSCEPCGTYMIPYPLSTGPNCGDPTYNKFNCNSSTGQVNFMMPKGESYQVIWINANDRKFYVRMSDKYRCDSNHQNETPVKPFNVTNWCFSFDNKIEVSWLPAPVPPCNEPRDCNGWLNSTCSSNIEGRKSCLCDSNYQWNASNLSCTQEEQSRNHSIKRLPLILTITLAGVIFLACTITFAVWRNKIALKIDKANLQIQESLYDSERRVKGMIGLGGLEEKDREGLGVTFYTFGSILAATENFSDSNKLGQGGYGPVYKGRFPGGQDIAVKRLSTASTQGLEEFKNEVVLIAKLQPRNLVRLRGYCIEGDEKILLYEYMPNKSLDSFIFDRTRTLILDWQMRFDIILGIARGLLYLHQDSRLRVIHRDLKTSNILLDDEMTPKISDFGLAKIFGGKETEASTRRVVGTYGYMAPEYALDGFFSIKSDVFSFGVVLLEILSGKKNTGFYQSKQTASLLGYAWGLWTENRLLDLMDASLGETCNESQFVKCALIGLLCVQDEPGDRPNVSNVVTMLDSEIATIPIPTQPTFYAMKRLSSTASIASSSSKPETTLQFDTTYEEGR